MTALVDVTAGAVIDGVRRWPLRLDCRTGGAVLTLAAGTVTVAPLAWRQKQRLARWAHLGPDFVAAQRVALAVDPAITLDPDDAAAVAAVAAYLDGPELPLTPELLAAVSIEACRATGRDPSAFDDRDARDVELMWQIAPGARLPDLGAPSPAPGTLSPAHAADPWADATSIVFRADEPAPLGAGPSGSDRVETSVPGPADAAPSGPERAVGAAVRAPIAHEPTITLPGSSRREAPRYRIAPVPARAPVTIAAARAAAPTDAPPSLEGSRAGGRSAAPVPAAAPAPAPAGDRHVPGPGAASPVVHRGPLIPPAATTAIDGGQTSAPTFSPGLSTGPGGPRPDPVTVVDDAGLDDLADAVAARLAGQLASVSADLGLSDPSTGG